MITVAPVDAFRLAIEQAGLTAPDAIITDGKLHRFASNGDRADDAGWYTYFPDETPAGVFGCWRKKVKQTWSGKADSTLTPAERARQRVRLDEARRQREHDERLWHAEAATRAQTIWDRATPAPEDHPYLQRKRIQPHGLRVDDEHRLIVPVTINGAISSLQFIDAHGGKQFLHGGKVRGGTFTMCALRDVETLLLCEGFATGASLYQATGYPTVCAFSAGNLKTAALSLRRQHPAAAIVLGGDNDLHDDGMPNAGLEAATAAAKAIGGVLAMPEFDGKKCDFNDIHMQRGLDAVKEAITTALKRTQEPEAMTKTTATMESLTRYAHLLDGPEPIPPPRLPQDFRDGRLSIGVVIDGQAYAMYSDREILSAKEVLAVDYGLANVRFSKEGIKRFLRGEDMNGADLMARLESFLRRFVVMGEDLPALLALWLVGTHLYMVFEYFPYFVLRSPEKRCGKSRALDLIALLGFNAHQPTASPTEAQIFREPREDGGVQIYDELEGMTGDKERWGAVTGVFNVGFHRGSVVSRYRKTKGGQQKETFETYVPRAIASISSLEATLEDRAIMVMMQRLLPGQQTERFSLRRLNQEAQRLRDDLYLFALCSSPSIAKIYDEAEFTGLQDLDHRAVDLWEPLLSIAAVIDASGMSSDLTNRMTRLAERLGGDRISRSGDDTIPAIIETLNDCLSFGSETRISTQDFIEKVRLRLGWDTLTPKALANRLHPLGLRTTRWREGKDLRRGYIVKRDQIDDLVRRYTPETSGTHRT